MKCINCGKEIVENKSHDKYLFHIIDKNGQTNFVNACCIECAKKTIEKNANVHFNRWKDVKNQIPQRMRADEKC